MATRQKKTRAAPRKRAAPKKKRPAARRANRKKPESLRLRESSLSLTVNDLKRSIAWYRDVLGFTEGEQWEEKGAVQGQQMKAGSVDLMLNQDDFTKGRDRHKGDGVRVWWSTAQSLYGLAAMIKTRGGKLDYGPSETPWGDHAFGLTDPDGYHITIVAAPASRS
jgi:catechol 2,3-dioxygenase-like lactoylglutathione lyase family enzyme